MRTLREIDKDIAKYEAALKGAKRKRQLRQVASYQRHLSKLRAERRSVAAGASSRRSGPPRSQRRDGTAKSATKQPASASIRKFDKYHGVKLTSRNARAARIFYAALIVSPGIPLAMKGYAASRLALARRMERGGVVGSSAKERTGRLRAGRLRAAAGDLRRKAKIARSRRDVAASTRFETRAAQLDQDARTAEIQDGATDEAYRDYAVDKATQSYRPQVDEEMTDESAVEAAGSSAAAETDAEAETGAEEGEAPWYKKPLTWIVLGAVIVGGAVYAKKKGIKSPADVQKKLLVFGGGLRRKVRKISTAAA